MQPDMSAKGYRIQRLDQNTELIAASNKVEPFPTKGWSDAHSLGLERHPLPIPNIESSEAKPLTRRLVGFIVRQLGSVVPKENHLVLEDQRMVGRVTSCAYSPTLERVIGLAYVPPDSSSPGDKITIKCDHAVLLSAEVVALPFFDPDNSQQEVDR